jgi:hypothetical protein
MIPLHPLCPQLSDEGHFIEPGLAQFPRGRYLVRVVVPVVRACPRGILTVSLLSRRTSGLPFSPRPVSVVSLRRGPTTLTAPPPLNTLETVLIDRDAPRLGTRYVAPRILPRHRWGRQTPWPPSFDVPITCAPLGRGLRPGGHTSPWHAESGWFLTASCRVAWCAARRGPVTQQRARAASADGAPGRSVSAAGGGTAASAAAWGPWSFAHKALAASREIWSETAPVASPVTWTGRSGIPRRSAPSSWPRTPAVTPGTQIPPTRVVARATVASAASADIAAGGSAIDSVEQLAQAAPQHGIRVAIAASASAAPPLRHTDRGQAAAAAAVVSGQTPPGGVERNKRSRSLPLPAGPPMPRLLPASRGAEDGAAAGAVARAKAAERRGGGEAATRRGRPRPKPPAKRGRRGEATRR